jgi:hypothetical protein
MGVQLDTCAQSPVELQRKVEEIIEAIRAVIDAMPPLEKPIGIDQPRLQAREAQACIHTRMQRLLSRNQLSGYLLRIRNTKRESFHSPRFFRESTRSSFLARSVASSQRHLS